MIFQLQLMKNPSTPLRFWLPLLYDSVTSFYNDDVHRFLMDCACAIGFSQYPLMPGLTVAPVSFLQLELLNWKDRPLFNVSQTNLLLNKLQELSMARLRPDFIEAELPPQALNSIRLALATNLGRAILEE